MNNQRKDSNTSSIRPDALQYDETTQEYINAEQDTPDERLPEPPEDHIEESKEGERYRVHDPARDSFEIEHNAPLTTPMARQIQELAAPVNGASRASSKDESMRAEEEDQTAAEMLQDDWIDEQEMLDMAQLDDVLDPVESE